MDPTALVVTVKVAVVAPAATVTLAGTCAAAVLPLDSVTTAPLVRAGPLKVTVPVDELPPVTEDELRVTETMPTELKLNAVILAPLIVVP